jgi:hypothetical protein
MRKPFRIAMIVWLVIGLIGMTAQAQTARISDLSEDEQFILNEINERRLPQNLIHLVPNEDLMSVADVYLNDLLARPIGNFGDVFVQQDGQEISSLLALDGYEPYPTGYIVDFVPAIVRNVPPEEFVNFWLNDARSDNPTVQSLRIVQGTDQFLPMFSSRYREVGLAYEFDEESERHYYVLVFAAQPNVLPVIAVPNISGATDSSSRRILATVTETVPSRDILLYIHNERVNRFGGQGNIGSISLIRVSQSSAEQPCPATASGNFENYSVEVPFTLGGPENIPQTVFVQMCDDFGESITQRTEVTIGEVMENIPPEQLVIEADVLGIANATQTAAASATAFAPVLQTVEVILTATAMPQTPAPDERVGPVFATPTPTPAN